MLLNPGASAVVARRAHPSAPYLAVRRRDATATPLADDLNPESGDRITARGGTTGAVDRIDHRCDLVEEARRGKDNC